MPTNFELKAVVSSSVLAEQQARRLKARRVGTLRQIDTYYRVPRGRLKVREINSKRAELIYYHRSNTQSSRYSDYHIVKFPSALEANKFCAQLFKTLVVVRKRRILYLYQNARIHIDRVSGLGSFVEFEILVTKGKPQARKLMQNLIAAFGIQKKSIIGTSYSDLLLRKK
ncbi:MAG: class IV adenylate cyclase [Ignavibacteriae bacterium]|nr:class IV adenylate cyclase [Ignavibacteriota bacterium]